MLVLGNGRPSVPGRRASVSGLPSATGDVSVMPYPSITRPPVTCSHFCAVAAGSAIAPEIAYRNDVRSAPDVSAAAARRSSIGGTAGRKVPGKALLRVEHERRGRTTGTRRASRRRASRSSGTASARRRGRTAGRRRRRRCRARRPVHAWPCTAFATRLRCVSIAPLGVPVVPPVYCRSATSDADGAGCAGSSGCGLGDEPVPHREGRRHRAAHGLRGRGGRSGRGRRSASRLPRGRSAERSTATTALSAVRGSDSSTRGTAFSQTSATTAPESASWCASSPAV